MAVATGEFRGSRVTARDLRRWLSPGLAALVVAALAVGLWVALDEDTTTGEALAGDVVAAWNEPSETLFARAYADDAVLIDAQGLEYTGLDEIVAIAVQISNSGTQFTRVGPVAENASWVAFGVDLTRGNEVIHDVSVFELDDDGLIVEHTGFGERWEPVE